MAKILHKITFKTVCLIVLSGEGNEVGLIGSNTNQTDLNQKPNVSPDVAETISRASMSDNIINNYNQMDILRAMGYTPDGRPKASSSMSKTTTSPNDVITNDDFYPDGQDIRLGHYQGQMTGSRTLFGSGAAVRFPSAAVEKRKQQLINKIAQEQRELHQPLDFEEISTAPQFDVKFREMNFKAVDNFYNDVVENFGQAGVQEVFSKDMSSPIYREYVGMVQRHKSFASMLDGVAETAKELQTRYNDGKGVISKRGMKAMRDVQTGLQGVFNNDGVTEENLKKIQKAFGDMRLEADIASRLDKVGEKLEAQTREQIWTSVNGDLNKLGEQLGVSAEDAKNALANAKGQSLFELYGVVTGERVSDERISELAHSLQRHYPNEIWDGQSERDGEYYDIDTAESYLRAFVGEGNVKVKGSVKSSYNININTEPKNVANTPQYYKSVLNQIKEGKVVKNKEEDFISFYNGVFSGIVNGQRVLVSSSDVDGVYNLISDYSGREDAKVTGLSTTGNSSIDVQSNINNTYGSIGNFIRESFGDFNIKLPSTEEVESMKAEVKSAQVKTNIPSKFQTAIKYNAIIFDNGFFARDITTRENSDDFRLEGTIDGVNFKGAVMPAEFLSETSKREIFNKKTNVEVFEKKDNVLFIKNHYYHIDEDAGLVYFVDENGVKMKVNEKTFSIEKSSLTGIVDGALESLDRTLNRQSYQLESQRLDENVTGKKPFTLNQNFKPTEEGDWQVADFDTGVFIENNEGKKLEVKRVFEDESTGRVFIVFSDGSTSIKYQ